MRSGGRSISMTDTIATAYVQIEPTFDGVANKLKGEFSKSGESAGKEAGEKAGSGFASVLGTTAKVAVGAMTAAVSAGAAAVTGLTKAATDSFGQYEQLVGGVETLFGDAAGKVQENAAKAFATAGMSANEYMETVTGFSASLLQSLGGDTQKAADVADMALQDMSDNANKMGTSMESIKVAYQGFAKQNYTMLDNLKLGYGGTKTEMQRLLQDAEKISGVKYDMSNLNDVYEAIHVVQTEMGITGTTAKEAATTLEGSFASMSAAWANVVTSLGSGQNLGENIDTLVKTAETYVSNLLPVIEQALGGVSQLIEGLAPVIAEKLPALVEKIVPSLLQSAAQIMVALASALTSTLPVILQVGMDVLNQLMQGFLQAIPQAIPMIMEFLSMFTQFIMDNAPLLLEAATQIIFNLALGLAEQAPMLIPAALDLILALVMNLLDNVDQLVDAAIALTEGLANGLVNALPILIEKAPIIIVKFVSALLQATPKLLEAGYEAIVTIVTGLKTYLPQLLNQAPLIMSQLKQKFLDFIPKLVEVGKNIVEGIKTGISDAWDSFVNWMGEKMSEFVGGIKKFFGIESPSKLFADEVGRWIPAGIAEGIDQGMGILDKEIETMTNDMIQTSINPTVMSQYTPEAESDDLSLVIDLLNSWLPLIASNTGKKMELGVNASQLFRVIQQESIRNTELVGTGAVLSAT